jgi:hypothetical protein
MISHYVLLCNFQQTNTHYNNASKTISIDTNSIRMLNKPFLQHIVLITVPCKNNLIPFTTPKSKV